MRQTVFRDDLTNEIIEDPDFTPTKLSLNNQHYEMDLNAASVEKLTKALDRFLKNARPVTTTRSSKPLAPKINPETAKIRAWAKEQGIDIAERGRIDSRIVEAYRKQDPSLATKEHDEPVELEEIEDELEDLV